MTTICLVCKNQFRVKLSTLKKGHGKYCSLICRGKAYYLGSYKTPEEAASAYNKAAKELAGEFAYLNVVS